MKLGTARCQGSGDSSSFGSGMIARRVSVSTLFIRYIRYTSFVTDVTDNPGGLIHLSSTGRKSARWYPLAITNPTHTVEDFTPHRSSSNPASGHVRGPFFHMQSMTYRPAR
jgi:hypothetical protein